MSDKFTLSKVQASFTAALNERSEFEAEWRTISNYLLPGRGIYQTYSKPRKRQLTSPKIQNNIAEDSLNVLSSGIHGGLTSPSRIWFNLEWADEKIQQFEPLKAWLQDATKRLHKALHSSNFYSVINSFYTEYGGFGNSSLYIGEDTEDQALDAFRFELLTVGEYAVELDSRGLIYGYYRTFFLTPRQMVDKFGSAVASTWANKVKNNEASADSIYVTVLEYVCREPFQGKPYSQRFYDLGTSTRNEQREATQGPMRTYGFHEMPYIFGRWSTIGSDVYGIGPGSRALPDIKRLQEMEVAILMAAHKAVDPPLNVPGRMRGKVNTLPGGRNYYSNPSEVIQSINGVGFDIAATASVIERVEERIRTAFFSDIFLTNARDPNASPLRTGQVQVMEQEKMLRLGPVIERLQHEVFMPLLERCFNIMLRKKMFQELSDDLKEMAGEYKITLVSPLATAQRAMAMSGIQTFMQFIGQAAQFDQSILDNINADKAAREVADISGVQLGILRQEKEVQQIRQQRQQQQQEQQMKAEAAAAQQLGNDTQQVQADDRLKAAQAGKTLAETQQITGGMM